MVNNLLFPVVMEVTTKLDTVATGSVAVLATTAATSTGISYSQPALASGDKSSMSANQGYSDHGGLYQPVAQQGGAATGAPADAPSSGGAVPSGSYKAASGGAAACLQQTPYER